MNYVDADARTRQSYQLICLATYALDSEWGEKIFLNKLQEFSGESTPIDGFFTSQDMAKSLLNQVTPNLAMKMTGRYLALRYGEMSAANSQLCSVDLDLMTTYTAQVLARQQASDFAGGQLKHYIQMLDDVKIDTACVFFQQNFFDHDAKAFDVPSLAEIHRIAEAMLDTDITPSEQDELKNLLTNRLNIMFNNGAMPLLDLLAGLTNKSTFKDKLDSVIYRLTGCRDLEELELELANWGAWLKYSVSHELREINEGTDEASVEVLVNRVAMLDTPLRRQIETFAMAVTDPDKFTAGVVAMAQPDYGNHLATQRVLLVEAFNGGNIRLSTLSLAEKLIAIINMVSPEGQEEMVLERLARFVRSPVEDDQPDELDVEVVLADWIRKTDTLSFLTILYDDSVGGYTQHDELSPEEALHYGEELDPAIVAYNEQIDAELEDSKIELPQEWKGTTLLDYTPSHTHFIQELSKAVFNLADVKMPTSEYAAAIMGAISIEWPEAMLTPDLTLTVMESDGLLTFVITNSKGETKSLTDYWLKINFIETRIKEELNGLLFTALQKLPANLSKEEVESNLANYASGGLLAYRKFFKNGYLGMGCSIGPYAVELTAHYINTVAGDLHHNDCKQTVTLHLTQEMRKTFNIPTEESNMQNDIPSTDSTDKSGMGDQAQQGRGETGVFVHEDQMAAQAAHEEAHPRGDIDEADAANFAAPLAGADAVVDLKNATASEEEVQTVFIYQLRENQDWGVDLKSLPGATPINRNGDTYIEIALPGPLTAELVPNLEANAEHYSEVPYEMSVQFTIWADKNLAETLVRLFLNDTKENYEAWIEADKLKQGIRGAHFEYREYSETAVLNQVIKYQENFAGIIARGDSLAPHWEQVRVAARTNPDVRVLIGRFQAERMNFMVQYGDLHTIEALNLYIKAAETINAYFNLTRGTDSIAPKTISGLKNTLGQIIEEQRAIILRLQNGVKAVQFLNQIAKFDPEAARAQAYANASRGE